MNRDERGKKLILEFFQVMENFYDQDDENSDVVTALTVMSIAMAELSGIHADILRTNGSDSIVTHFKNMTVNQIEAI